jgi:hypothetical protein
MMHPHTPGYKICWVSEPRLVQELPEITVVSRMPLFAIVAGVLSLPYISGYDSVRYCNDSAGKNPADLASIQVTGNTQFRIAGKWKSAVFVDINTACQAACAIQFKYGPYVVTLIL